jgi:titin
VQTGPVRTWYQVTPSGLEQGFSISRPSFRPGHELLVDLGPAAGWRVGSGGTSLVETDAGRGPALAYGALATNDAAGATESSRFVIRHGEAEIAVHISPGASWPIRIDPTWTSTSTPTATLTDSADATGSKFGYAVALSSDGTTALVGALAVNSYTGAAYVFHASGEGSWATTSTVTATLTDSTEPADSELGYAVTLSADGTTALVGAYGVSSQTGAVDVFHVAGEGSWATTSTPTATLTDSTDTTYSDFGFSVALSAGGTTALVGAMGANGFTGKADVFEVAGAGSWATTSTPTATLTDSADVAADSEFGSGVALSADGTTALVGAGGVNSFTGAADVFHVSGEASWATTSTPTATLTDSADTTNSTFGLVVALSADGTTALIGDRGGASGTGAADVFHVSGEDSWATTTTPTATLSDSADASSSQFGFTVAISADGTTALVGAYGTGVADVFHVAGQGSWATTSTPTATLTHASGEAFGVAVALSADGTTALVGAYNGGNSYSGAAYAFNIPGESLWTTATSPLASVAATYRAGMGFAVALSSDGTTALVGAYTVNNVGAAYVFHVSGEGSWATTSTPTATLTDSADTAGSSFGSAVALSADGTTALVGAYGVSSFAGASDVFHVSGNSSWATTSTPSATLTDADEPANGSFGRAVALSADGTTALVGATSASAADIFHVSGEGSWATTSKPTATVTDSADTAGSSFGSAVALSSDGTTALVGAYNANSAIGAADIFHVSGEVSWATTSTPTATLTDSADTANSTFGRAVALSADGTTALIGASGVNSNTGAADVFNVAGSGSWATTSVPTATLTDSSDAANYLFGRAVALSADGITALVGVENIGADLYSIPTPPGAPSSASGTAGTNAATVSWDAGVDDGAAVTSYTVTPYVDTAAQAATTFDCGTGTGEIDCGATPISATVTGLQNGTAYTFTVIANNKAGAGPASSSSNSVTPAAAPAAPTAVAASGGSGSATVSFSASSSDGGAPVVFYTVTPYVGPTAQSPTMFDCGTDPGEIDCGAAPVSATVTGLQDGTTYTFTVTASNDVATSASSDSSNSVLVGAPDTPGTPSASLGSTQTAGDGQVTLSWTAAAPNSAAVTAYTVTPYIGASAQTAITFTCGLAGDLVCNAAPVTAIIDGLNPGTAYTFSVVATNSYGAGPASPASNSFTPYTIPGAPGSPTATTGNTSAGLSFTPALANGSTVTSYTVTPYIGTTAESATTFACGTGSGAINCGVSPISAKVTGLAPGTAYSFTVEATNQAGAGAASSPSNSVTTYAANGSGTMTVSPAAVSASSKSDTLSFAYTAATGGTSGGEIEVVVPSGWSVPSKIATAAGYVTSTCGTVAVSGSIVKVTAMTVAGTKTCTITYGSKAGHGPGAVAPAVTGADTFKASEASASAGTLATLRTSPVVKVYAANGSGTAKVAPTSVKAGSKGITLSFGFTAATGGTSGGEIALIMPSGWSAPSKTANAAGYVTSTCGTVAISGSTIKVTGMTLAGTKTCTITYGSKAGHGPGAVAPTAAGTDTFKTFEASTSPGTLTLLRTSPVVNVLR